MKRGFSTLGMLATLAALALALPAVAAEPAQCRTVRLSSPGWADIDATNAVLALQLKALGYEPKIQLLSVPLTYQGLRGGQLDLFLGNWMPAQKNLVEPLLAKKQVERLATNLERARFTLAVPSYAADAGVHSFADLKKFADAFSRKIYGIEAGAPANESIKRMIASNTYGLGDWQLVESSDSGLLAQLGHDIRNHKMVLFLAWEPHIVNTRFQINYLNGGEEYFGADGGAASVSTVIRPGYREQCANVSRLLSQLKFTVPFENELLRLNVEQHQDFETAAKTMLAKNSQLLAGWLAGVKTWDGADAYATVRKAIGLN